MTSIRLTILALAILAASAVAGIAAYSAGVVDPGITYGFSHDDAGRQTLVVVSVRPGGLAWHEGVEPGFVVLSVDLDVDGGGIDEQVYTPPGAVEAQQAAAAASRWPVVYMAKPGELPSPLPPDDLGSQVFATDWAVVRLEESALALLAAGLLCLAGLVWLGYRRFARKPALGVEAPLLAAAASPLVPAARLPHADPDPGRADEVLPGLSRPRHQRRQSSVRPPTSAWPVARCASPAAVSAPSTGFACHVTTRSALPLPRAWRFASRFPPVWTSSSLLTRTPSRSRRSERRSSGSGGSRSQPSGRCWASTWRAPSAARKKRCERSAGSER
jgi:hypothetical protein